jgi:6-phosphogluconolactonase/glucosamine-6-phosphate isomerase/deaminase
LREFFPDPAHTFDLVLLGLGDNAHTLSLFPAYEVLLEKEQWVKAFYLEVEKIYRITLTAPVINAGRDIAFLVSGPGRRQLCNMCWKIRMIPGNTGAAYPAGHGSCIGGWTKRRLKI